MANPKKFGGEDGHTLEQLKRMAAMAETLNGVRFEGNSAKVSAILGLAAVGGELICEIERLQRELDECNAELEGT